MTNVEILLTVLTVLVFLLVVATVALAMRTTELNASVSALATAVSALSTSVDAAVDALKNRGNVTPDADVDAAITNINTQTVAVADLKSRLDAALNPT